MRQHLSLAIVLSFKPLSCYGRACSTRMTGAGAGPVRMLQACQNMKLIKEYVSLLIGLYKDHVSVSCVVIYFLLIRSVYLLRTQLTYIVQRRYRIYRNPAEIQNFTGYWNILKDLVMGIYGQKVEHILLTFGQVTAYLFYRNSGNWFLLLLKCPSFSLLSN